MTTLAQSSAVPEPRAGDLDPTSIRRQVNGVLADFLHRKEQEADRQGLPGQAPQVLGEFLLAGGKRIRPRLCLLGWQTAGGNARAPEPVVRVAAALELFHAFCLIHDDVIDHSDTRRGQPTVHRTLAAHHDTGRTPAATQQVGEAGAILVGDLALVWAEELWHTAGLDSAQLTGVRPLISAMRSEVIYGQYLDVTATGTGAADLDQALRIIRYKTAKYTVERPLQVGAALAGADDQLLEALTAFALPLGEAFQLRDDLLGVFGNEAETGKPALDDLREGKPTALYAYALMRADASQQRLLRAFYGNPRLDTDTAVTVRNLIEATGAAQVVEDMIHERHRHALSALHALDIPTQVRDQLRDLADQAAWRST